MRLAPALAVAVVVCQLSACRASSDGSPVPLRPNGVCSRELTDALRSANGPEVRALLARHAQVRCKEPVDGAARVRPWTTPLELAVATGQAEMVHLIIAAGASPADDEMEAPAIHRAVSMRRVDLVRILVEAGAAANSHSGRPLLWEAVLQDDVAIVSLLLQHGADPNQRWFSELQPGGTASNPEMVLRCAITPLMEVAAHGSAQLVPPLLRAGANKLDLDCKGRSAIDYARRYNHGDVVNSLSR